MQNTPCLYRRQGIMAKVTRETVEKARVDVDHLVDLLVKECGSRTHDILLLYNTHG